MALQEIGLIRDPNPYYQKGNKQFFFRDSEMFPLIRI